MQQRSFLFSCLGFVESAVTVEEDPGDEKGLLTKRKATGEHPKRRNQGDLKLQLSNTLKPLIWKCVSIVKSRWPFGLVVFQDWARS